MDHALAGRLVQLAVGRRQQFRGLCLVACMGSFAEGTDSGTKRGLHRLVAQPGALVGAVALLLRLDVGHVQVPFVGVIRLPRLSVGYVFAQKRNLWSAGMSNLRQHETRESAKPTQRDPAAVAHTRRTHLRRLQHVGRLCDGLRRNVRCPGHCPRPLQRYLR
ncbi:hypothetical protein BN9982_470013 [Mycobacterium tuberculosis]|nr:hypothetical protein BN9982_470013 [Mycobacterium tuberculosis]